MEKAPSLGTHIKKTFEHHRNRTLTRRDVLGAFFGGAVSGIGLVRILNTADTSPESTGQSLYDMDLDTVTPEPTPEEVASAREELTLLAQEISMVPIEQWRRLDRMLNVNKYPDDTEQLADSVREVTRNFDSFSTEIFYAAQAYGKNNQSFLHLVDTSTGILTDLKRAIADARQVPRFQEFFDRAQGEESL